MLTYLLKEIRAAKTWLLLKLIISVLVLFHSDLRSQDLARIEISLDIGYTYQPQKILNNYSDVLTKPEDLSFSIISALGISITKIGKKGIHKIRGSFGGWHHSVTFRDQNEFGNSSFSNTYLFTSYQYGKRWDIFNNNRLTLQMTIGPNFALRQPAELNTSEEFSFLNQGRLILVEPQNYQEPDVSLGIVLESNVSVQIYKKLSLQIGINGFYWPKTVYGDRTYKIRIDNIENPDIIIRTYKHIWSFSGGFKFEF